MRIVVVSDSHGDEMDLQRIILAQPKADIIIHLGDGAEEMERVKRKFPEKMVLQVKGNCDLGSDLPVSDTFTAEGVKLFFTHGHGYGVKSGLYNAVCAAREQGAQVLLYGHTHQKYTDYDDGLYILNPGAVSGWQASYGIVDITPQGIVTNVINLPV